MMRRRNAFAILGVFLVAVLTVRAEDFWVKKDWTKWSKDECNKILQDSPWSKQWAKSTVNVTASLPGNSGANAEGAGGEKSPEIHYNVQLRSSLPVRQAVVRLQQIQGYSKLTDEQKKEFDAKADAYFKTTFDDVILVHVDYGSNIQNFERDMATYFKNIREDSVPVDFYLINEKGERISPVKFSSPKNGSYAFDLIFPRMKDNEPVIHQGDKSMNFQFVSPAVGASASALDSSIGAFGREQVLIQFKPDKMMFQGKLSF
jgi:hypothetical protein